MTWLRARFARRGLAGLIAWPGAEPVFAGELLGAARQVWSPHADERISALAAGYQFLLEAAAAPRSPPATAGPAMKVAIYARVSTERQAECGTIGSPLQVLREHVTATGDDLAGEYVDDGHSPAREPAMTTGRIQNCYRLSAGKHSASCPAL